jgi:predicted GH43/DUF377 family glycosyl hydrolase
MDQARIFRTAELLPESWSHFAADGPVRIFNPGLMRDGDGFVFAYRVVGPDLRRRIGLCRLDRHLEVVAGSPIAWSDLVQFRPGETYPDPVPTWFADPRLYRLEGRIFVYWNSGWHEPRNYQFLQEVDARTLKPIGFAREMVLVASRQKLEKNWMLFTTQDGALRAVYSAVPQRILEFSIRGEGAISFSEMATTTWGVPAFPHHGGLRGGAPPIEHGGAFWSFCHVVQNTGTGYRYSCAVYAFDPTPLFAPLFAPSSTLALPTCDGAAREHPPLNPAIAEVIYPCGAARDGDAWLVSYGINDEHAAIARVTDAEVSATLASITS